MSTDGLPPIVVKAHEKLRRAANHLSLSLFEDNRLLFMGDAESSQIIRRVSDLKSAGRTTFYAFVTPHHGTHWHNSLNVDFRHFT